MRVLPATQTVGSLDPHVLQIELPTFSKLNVEQSIAGTGNIKSFQVLAHEMRHWFDIIGTVWGQNYLSLLFESFDQTTRDTADIAGYPSALKMFDEDRSILFPSYYKFVSREAVAASGPGLWQMQMSTGVNIDTAGYGNEDQPIYFVRFYSELGDIGRQPLTIGALLELRALYAEQMAYQIHRERKSFEENLIDDNLYKKDLLDLIYRPEFITYSTAAHLLAFAIGGTDMLGVFILGSHAADLALNFTPETYKTFKVPYPVSACGERRMSAFLRNQDRGYAFAALCYWMRNVIEEQLEGEPFQTALKRAGVRNFDAVYGAAEEYIRSLSATNIRNPRLREIREKTLDAGRKIIGYRRLCGNSFPHSSWKALPTPPIMDKNLEYFFVGEESLTIEDVEFLHECNWNLRDYTRQALRAGRGFDFSYTDYVY